MNAVLWIATIPAGAIASTSVLRAAAVPRRNALLAGVGVAVMGVLVFAGICLVLLITCLSESSVSDELARRVCGNGNTATYVGFTSCLLIPAIGITVGTLSRRRRRYLAAACGYVVAGVSPVLPVLLVKILG